MKLDTKVKRKISYVNIFQKINKLSASFRKLGLEAPTDGHLNKTNPTHRSRETSVDREEKGNC